MLLRDWIQEQGVTRAEFGRRIGVKSRMTVGRYCSGERMPAPRVMARILVETGGVVTPNDFFQIAERLKEAS